MIVFFVLCEINVSNKHFTPPFNALSTFFIFHFLWQDFWINAYY